MKKLNKLIINPEKALKINDLKELRGGWTGYCAVYYGSHLQEVGEFCFPGFQGTFEEINNLCADIYKEYGHEDAWCFCNYGY
jgi:hypothetical protein